MKHVNVFLNLKNSELYSLAEIYTIMQGGEYHSAQKKLFLLAKVAEPADGERSRSHCPPPTSPPSSFTGREYSEVNKYILRKAIRRCYNDLLFLRIERCLRYGDELFLNRGDYVSAMTQYTKIEKFLELLSIESFLQKLHHRGVDDESHPIQQDAAIVMQLSLLHHYYHNKALLFIHFSGNYEMSVSLFKQAISIKEMFMSCYSQQEIVNKFKSAADLNPRQMRLSSPAPNEERYETIFTASRNEKHFHESSMIQFWYYFLVHFTVSEANLLICLIHNERYKEGLAIVKTLKDEQQFYDLCLKDLPLVQQHVLRKEEASRLFLEKLCHAYCLIKYHRLLEAEIILRKPSDSTYNWNQLEKFWIMLEDLIAKERKHFREEIGHHSNLSHHRRPHPQQLKDSQQPNYYKERALMSPEFKVSELPSQGLSTQIPISDETHLDLPDPRINIYKTIHFAPSSSSHKKKIPFESKTSLNAIPKLSEDTNIGSIDVKPLITDTISEIKAKGFFPSTSPVSEDIISDPELFPENIALGSSPHTVRKANHARKLPLFQSCDVKDIKQLCLEAHEKNEKPKIRRDDQIAVSTAIPTHRRLGRPHSISNDFHSLSDSQRQPHHSRRESSNSSPLQSPDKLNIENKTAAAFSPVKASKPRYKSTSFDLFELRKVDDDQFNHILTPLKTIQENREREKNEPFTVPIVIERNTETRVAGRESVDSTPMTTISTLGDEPNSQHEVVSLQESFFTAFQQSEKPSRPMNGVKISTELVSSSSTTTSSMSRAVTEPLLIASSKSNVWSIPTDISTPLTTDTLSSELKAIVNEDSKNVQAIVSLSEQNEVISCINSPVSDKSELAPLIVAHAYSFSQSEIISSSPEKNHQLQHHHRHQFTALHYVTSDSDAASSGYLSPLREISDMIPDVSNLQFAEPTKRKTNEKEKLHSHHRSNSLTGNQIKENENQLTPQASSIVRQDASISSVAKGQSNILANRLDNDSLYLYSQSEDFHKPPLPPLRKKLSPNPKNPHSASLPSRIVTFYPYDKLRSPGPYPPDVDIKIREQYLDPQEFSMVFQMTKEEFNHLPQWKQKLKKKAALLF